MSAAWLPDTLMPCRPYTFLDCSNSSAQDTSMSARSLHFCLEILQALEGPALLLESDRYIDERVKEHSVPYDSHAAIVPFAVPQ